MADSFEMAQLYDALADRAVRLCYAAGDPPQHIDFAWWRYMIRTTHRDIRRIAFARIEAMDDEAALEALREINRLMTHRPRPAATAQGAAA